MAEDTHHIVTIGIKPNAPMTGYGYIEVGDKMNFTSKTVFRKVCGFNEKPSLELSEAYVADGKTHVEQRNLHLESFVAADRPERICAGYVSVL
ncbi:MAG: sugar phosphate nucleotidyltransferase [Victivallales bacterium]